MLAVALLLGLLIGLTLGALGGGGSILTVPALVYVLGQSPYEATTGSLIIVGITALAGMVAHARQGRVRLRQGLVFGVLGIGGSYVGSRLSSQVDPQVLLVGFAGLMLVAAGAMLRRSFQPDVPAEVPERTPAVIGGGADAGTGVTTAQGRSEGAAAGANGAAPESPAPTEGQKTRSSMPGRGRRRAAQAVRVVAAASLVGLLTGFFGVGGGFVIVPALVLVLQLPMPVAVGTSLLVIAINSTAALATRLHVGVSLEWDALAALTAAAVVGSLVGSKVVGRVNPRVLTRTFAALLVAVALYTAARSLSLLG
jgi:uncharacterized membrane protein YfcA